MSDVFEDELTEITATTKKGFEIKLYHCETNECRKCDGTGDFRDGDGYWTPEYICCEDCEGAGSIPAFTAEEIIISRLKFLLGSAIEAARVRTKAEKGWWAGYPVSLIENDKALLKASELLDLTQNS